MKRAIDLFDADVDPAKKRRSEPILVPQILFKFKHSSEKIFTIFPLDDASALVHTYRANTNAIVHKTGAVQKYLHHGEKFNSFSRNGEGQFFASNLYTRCLKKIDLEGNTRSFFTTFQYCPTSLCTSSNGKTFLGLLDPMTDDGFVMEIEEVGEMIRQTEIRVPEITYCPAWIAENVNGDKCVISMSKDNVMYKLVVLDSDWKVKFEYKGHPDFQNFEPVSVCCDSGGNILVADFKNDAIHILNQSGEFLQFLLTKADGLVSPSCIACDASGQFWIGCQSGDIYIVKYQDRE